MTHDSAEELKTQGNRYFQSQRFKEAIDAYTRAINKNNRISTYYTNRALTYIQMKRWHDAADDCMKALELDRNSVKAYYFWGRTAIHLEQYDEAIKHLAKAIDLAVGQKTNFGDEIHSQLRLARREKFKREEDKRITQEIGLVRYLEQLIDEDLERKMERFALSEDIMPDAEQDKEQNKLVQEAETYKAQLNGMLAQVDERRRRREIPDYLCGKISFELMRDPVITPSGITYDRADIRQHLQQVGHFDPVTRAPLEEENLIPNLAMKEVIEAFLTENEWAEYDDPM